MIPTIQIQVDEARFSEVAERGAENESGGGGLALVCILEEMLGAVFGSITLWYLVTSIARLA